MKTEKGNQRTDGGMQPQVVSAWTSGCQQEADGSFYEFRVSERRWSKVNYGAGSQAFPSIYQDSPKLA
jgi:hypothetical protein